MLSVAVVLLTLYSAEATIASRHVEYYEVATLAVDGCVVSSSRFY